MSRLCFKYQKFFDKLVDDGLQMPHLFAPNGINAFRFVFSDDESKNIINGFSLPFDYAALKKAADLIYEGGPILSLYVLDSDYYLFCWADCDNDRNRWMIFRSTLEKLRSYINGKVSLLHLLMNNPDGFARFADYDGVGEFPVRVVAVSVKEIPEDYLPAEDSLFTFGITDEIRDVLFPEDYKVSVPEKERSLFFSLVEKLGWRPSAAAL